MKFIDISWPLDEDTTIMPGEQPVLLEPIKTFAKDGAREHIIHLNAHTGTHVDAPSFLLRDGKTIDQIDIHTTLGPAIVLNLTGIEGSIKKEHLEALEINEGDIVLLKTKNSSLDPNAAYDSSFVYLDPSAAKYLVQKKVKTVGFDYITLEPEKEFDQSHRILLEKGITIIGGLRLFFVTPGLYFLVCLPLNVIGIEAAPARAVILDMSEELELESAGE